MMEEDEEAHGEETSRSPVEEVCGKEACRGGRGLLDEEACGEGGNRLQRAGGLLKRTCVWLA